MRCYFHEMRSLVVGVIVGALAGPVWAGHAPDLHSKAAIVIDASSGREIFGKHPDDVRAIASVTKIFVAMAVRKKGLDLRGWTEITKADAHEALGGSRTRLPVGEKFRNKDLLRAMLMVSDNRAPTALGRAAGMSHDQLVREMNRIAKQLHLKHTHFKCPTGLHGNHSTARELAIALRAALRDPVLREIMGDDGQLVVAKDGHPRIPYGTTDHALLADRYDVIGGKTGYTSAAGYCFIVAARLDGKEIVMSFLGAEGKEGRFTDFARMAGWFLQSDDHHDREHARRERARDRSPSRTHGDEHAERAHAHVHAHGHGHDHAQAERDHGRTRAHGHARTAAR
jgi:D-alanyl-D-alanine endopeptidase (penicillin-binding protein 7)